jgi:hypothetical protein
MVFWQQLSSWATEERERAPERIWSAISACLSEVMATLVFLRRVTMVECWAWEGGGLFERGWLKDAAHAAPLCGAGNAGEKPKWAGGCGLIGLDESWE